MPNATRTPLTAAPDCVQVEDWCATARRVLGRHVQPGYDELIAESADFEMWISRLVFEVVEWSQNSGWVTPTQEETAEEQVTDAGEVLALMPSGRDEAVSLVRIMARRVIRLSVVLNALTDYRGA